MYDVGEDQGFLRNNPHRSMSCFKTRRLATICALVVFSLLTLSFFPFPSGPGQLNNVAPTVEVAPTNVSEPEPLPVVPVDLFGAEFNLIGSPTPRFRGTGCHPISQTFELTVQPQIICEATVNTSRAGYRLVGVRRSPYSLSLLIASSSQRCHDLCEPRTYYPSVPNLRRQINLVYLAIITDRIPIIAMFTPSHVGGSAPPVDFGLVFDVPRLRTALGMPILEWHEVKDRNSETIDELGCWNTWESVQKRETFPRRSPTPGLLKLGKSFPASQQVLVH